MIEDAYEPHPSRTEIPLTLKLNAEQMAKLLIQKGKDAIISDEVMQLMNMGINNIKRIPGIEPLVIESLKRDWQDIIDLSECMGTEETVLRLMTEFLFEIAALGAYGGEPLVGISSGKIKYKGDCIHFISVTDENRNRIREHPRCKFVFKYPDGDSLKDKGCGDCKYYMTKETVKKINQDFNEINELRKE